MLTACFSLPLLLEVLPAMGLVDVGIAQDTDERPDAELVARAQKGDRGSQNALYKRHAPMLVRRATRLLARSGEAEDVLQDSFVEAFRDLHQLQDPSLFSHWLMRIATHQIHRRFRRRNLLRRLGFQSVDDACLEQLVDPTASPELRAQCAQLDTALQTLPATERVVWTLRHVEGCRLSEIVSFTELSLATVKRKLRHAHEKVQAYFASELPGSESLLAQSPGVAGRVSELRPVQSSDDALPLEEVGL